VALTDFEVVWDGRGLLDPRDWPPQRPQVPLTFEPSTDPKPRPPAGGYRQTCRACGTVFPLAPHRFDAGQVYCSRRCARHRLPGERLKRARA
jgi:hypothetical protein